MSLTEIRKRDGSIAAYDPDKISSAIGRAAASSFTLVDAAALDRLARLISERAEAAFGERLPDVEGVQDIVERALMESGLFTVAKAYILYRAEHAAKRQEEAEEAARNAKHYVTARGTVRSLNRSGLRSRFAAAAAASGTADDVDVEALVLHCETSLYDGIPEKELNSALTLAARPFIERDPAYGKLAARLVLTALYDEALEGDGSRKNYAAAFRRNLTAGLEAGRLDPELGTYELDALAEALVPERDGLLEYMGAQTLADRYLLREEGGERRVEAPQTFWMRIAMGLAIAEAPEVRTEQTIRFYGILSTLRYTPSTPTLFHAGTAYPQLSSCYLNVVQDDLTDIFKTYGDNAQLSKYSGGIGTSWSKIRATGAYVKTTNLESQGVIPFLRIANDVNIAINRSGKRRGAACVYLEPWHYEVEDFLDLRKNTGDERRRTHDINTALWIPDLFFKRVEAGEEWTLFSPDETPDLTELYGRAFERRYAEYERMADQGAVRLCRRLPARDLWRRMISMLFETGHPWITFKDACNVRSPQDHAGVIHNSNLCTEITLNNSQDETAVCNIGSVNLKSHLKGGELDYDLLKETVQAAVRMLDNTIDPNFYPTPETRNANTRHRPVGLGLMGFQDALFAMDVPFDSDVAETFADGSMEFISYWAIHTSAMLAKEKGRYASYAGSKWDRGIFPVDTLGLLETERGMPVEVDRTEGMDWAPVRAAVAEHGMRNSNVMAVAPTATISNINGCSPCIEPIYKNLYVKSNMSGEFTVVNEYLVDDLKKEGLWNADTLELLKRHDGSVSEIGSLPGRIRSKYRNVFEIGMPRLIRIAARRAKWIDQAQSLNIFFAGTSGKALADVYLQAWKSGLKTTYYLRTLGATGIEKSTVALEAAKSAGPGPEQAAVGAEAAAKPARAPTVPVAEGEVKACRIDDPSCESCQ